MPVELLLTSALLLAQMGRTLPTQTGPMRNTFVVAAETVVDNASHVDLRANTATSDAQMQQLKASRDTLAGMAEDDREKDAAALINDMVFAISACHLQATNGADTTTCKAQFLRARARVMEAIRKHKNGDAWVDGPPA